MARAVNRPGFTLVELLVVITIICMLAGLILGGLSSARQTAREAQTKATIAKLHNIIMAKWDSYRTRRVPMTEFDMRYYAYNQSPKWWSNPTTSLPPRVAARVRVNALRDLMRLEMPDRLGDLNGSSLVLRKAIPSAVPAEVNDVSKASQASFIPAISQRFQSIYASNTNPAKSEYLAAKCLYMIVMLTPGAAEQFRQNEVGDFCKDGLPVFLDGWGRPIRFLRWAPGFIPSLSADSDIQAGNVSTAPDPFDPLFTTDSTPPTPYTHFALIPLIYSAGPDGQYDINLGKTGTSEINYATVSGDINLYAADGNGFYVGQPLNGDTSTTSNLRHYDNIHNHRIEAK